MRFFKTQSLPLNVRETLETILTFENEELKFTHPCKGIICVYDNVKRVRNEKKDGWDIYNFIKKLLMNENLFNSLRLNVYSNHLEIIY